MKREVALQKVILASFLAFIASPAMSQEFGHFNGTVQTEWLGDDGEHRKMRLLADFSYVDPLGWVWLAPQHWVIDGASIPQLFWNVVGSPFDGAYRNASVIHDVACDQKKRPWKQVHRAFYNAMRAEGLGAFKSKLMYGAVYAAGPRWETRVATNVNPARVHEAVAVLAREIPEGYRGSILVSTSAIDEEDVPMESSPPSPWAEVHPNAYAKTTVALVVEEFAPRNGLQSDEVGELSAVIEAHPDISLDEIENLVNAWER